MTPVSPEWTEYYLNLENRLLGRAPQVVLSEAAGAADHIPELPPDQVRRHHAIVGILGSPDLPLVLEFLREQMAKQQEAVKADTATNEELRAARARSEMLEWIVKKLVGYVEEIDAHEFQRKAWLEEKQKQQPKS